MTREELRERVGKVVLSARGGDYPGWLDKQVDRILALLEQEPIRPPDFVKCLCGAPADIIEYVSRCRMGHQWPTSIGRAHDSEAGGEA